LIIAKRLFISDFHSPSGISLIIADMRDMSALGHKSIFADAGWIKAAAAISATVAKYRYRILSPLSKIAAASSEGPNLNS